MYTPELYPNGEALTDDTVPPLRFGQLLLQSLRLRSPDPSRRLEAMQKRNAKAELAALTSAIEASLGSGDVTPRKRTGPLTYLGVSLEIPVHIDDTVLPATTIEALRAYPGGANVITRTTHYRPDLKLQEVHTFSIGPKFSYSREIALVDEEGNTANSPNTIPDDWGDIDTMQGLTKSIERGTPGELLAKLTELRLEAEAWGTRLA